LSFWDSSALVPLVLEEPASPLLLRLVGPQEIRVVWWNAPVECQSAMQRRVRTSELTPQQREQAEELLTGLASVWIEVHPSASLRDRAVRLLAVHDLRAAAALQLAAALTWAEERPRGHAFVCLDERLREAARREGFLVLPEEAV
jgi:uncharacterized protein